ncbi:MAG TPA: response regulator [Ramlibacter sp.]
MDTLDAAVIDALPNPVYVKDSSGRYITVNAAWERYFGVGRELVLGQGALPGLEGASAARLERLDAELWESGGSQEFDAVLQTRQGPREALYSKTIVPGVGGRSPMLVGAIFDITARKQSERRRNMEHAVTRVLSDATNSADAITRVIQTICESLGWACGAHWCWDESAQLLRCTETWNIDDADVAEFVASAAQTVNEAPAWTGGAAPKTSTGGLVRRVWMEGAPIWFADVAQVPGFRRGAIAAKAGLHCAFGFPILASGNPLGMIEFYGRKIAEPDEALLGIVQAIGSQIGQFVKRRESELRSERFEAASLHKSQFLANMSHELRTPMNAIIGVSEMMLEDAADLGQEEQVEPLQRILRAAKHLLGLINDILDLSKIEAGKLELYTEDFDLKQVVEDVVSTVQPLAHKSGNQLVLECAPDLGSIRSDATRIKQALLNLASNAIKFTEKGTVTIRALRHKTGVETIVLQVRDTGIGIKPEQIGRLFQDFEQADASTTRRYGGTGLGLAISRRFCRMMGGDITVQSTPGKGSTFTIQLPAAGVPAAAQQAPSTAPQATTVVAKPSVAKQVSQVTQLLGATHGEATVLVVDDDPDVREFMSHFLERQGYAVATAANGIEALAKARELRPAAITLDVMMPDIDGWTVLAAIKGDPELAGIPVILMTIVDEKQRGYTLGATDYMVKPINRDRLAALLRKLCGRSTGRLLVVDDDEVSRGVMKAAVEREGWTVSEASHGRMALEQARAEKPDAVVLDLMMPEMDGFEFLDEFRKQEEWRSIPVLVVSALDLSAEERERLSGQVGTIIRKNGQDMERVLKEVSDTLAACIAGDSATGAAAA